MRPDPGLDARLREIVLRHTVVGGYPDTMAIAREAYALDRVETMTLERTVWRGDASRDETQDLDDWIRTAPEDMMERLLTSDLDVRDEGDQAFLGRIWGECAGDLDDLLSGGLLGDRGETCTYHWGDGERRAFRKAVERLRPGYLDPDPGQGSLL